MSLWSLLELVGLIGHVQLPRTRRVVGQGADESLEVAGAGVGGGDYHKKLKISIAINSICFCLEITPRVEH
jgi:hypothetical protein